MISYMISLVYMISYCYFIYMISIAPGFLVPLKSPQKPWNHIWYHIKLWFHVYDIHRSGFLGTMKSPKNHEMRGYIGKNYDLMILWDHGFYDLMILWKHGFLWFNDIVKTWCFVISWFHDWNHLLGWAACAAQAPRVAAGQPMPPQPRSHLPPRQSACWAAPQWLCPGQTGCKEHCEHSEQPPPGKS